MSDALPIPDDLAQLQRDRIAAENAVAQHIAEVDRLRSEHYPAPEQTQERARWSEEESAKLEELRAERDQLGRAVRQHPVMVQARDEGRFWATWDALQEAAREG
ncbi:hypothetical protein E6W39_24105 [Kitasatospora acidiphila]|uniref:Uncharacterized protein n=1 Tax=Kitasatospora acidiphila TaxID=2567942 RepID=A0A540W6U7_9ACTN|nr:hypothetical protein [Kitasatospora acidiphila]TQF04740.1 hypothetical protein E6W39_24105 [Kitasatospora acidiphila]